MTKSELPDDAGYIVLPKRLGWAAGAAAIGLMAASIGIYHSTNARIDAIAREVADIQKSRATNFADLKAKDAEFNARLDSLRELAYTQQSAILSRLTRMETLLERVEKNGRP